MRLIDADELLRRYDEEHEGPPGRARKLIEEAQTVNSWISVMDKTPKLNNVCLIVFDPPKTCKQVMQVYVDHAGSYWRGNVQLIANWVTHWMPLPEPPKENVNED